MSFTLGTDMQGRPVNWNADRGCQNTLTINGSHGSGKTMLADSLIAQAVADGDAVIRFDNGDAPLPSPLVTPVAWSDRTGVLDVLDRSIAEMERRTEYRKAHGVEGVPEPRPLMLVFEDMYGVMRSDDKFYAREIGKRLNVMVRGVRGLRVYMVLVSLTFDTDTPMALGKVLSESGHVQLGFSPIESYVLPSNRELAGRLLTGMADHDFHLPPGHGFFEDRFGGLQTFRNNIRQGGNNA